MKNTKQHKICHIYNRGNRKELICLEQVDYDVLFNLIQRSFDQYNFDIISICIMPNHFHLLVVQTGRISISKPMHNIGTKYPQYINKKYELSGHLFQDSYKCKEVSDFIYFRKIVDYIHKNPNKVRVGGDISYRLYENKFLQDYYNVLLTYWNE